MHDVDESMMTIVHHGGEWWRGSNAGITHRDVAGEPSTISDVAASRRRHLKMFIYYTDEHDVDENLRTIASYGESPGSGAGIACRHMNDIHTNMYSYVASSDISKLIIYYTDWHDVDEDVVTITAHGGYWTETRGSGVAFRAVNYTHTFTNDGVASSTVEIF